MGTSTKSPTHSKTSTSRFSGAGNRFLCADNRDGCWQLEPAAIEGMCTRKGCDGVVLVERSRIGDIRMRIYNADGSEAEMCGNGLRCFKRYLTTLGLDAPTYNVETGAGLRKVWDVDHLIAAEMGTPQMVAENVQLGRELTVDLIDTGVPHAIVFVDEIEEAPIHTYGPHIRHHPQFAPRGANATFVQMESPTSLAIRTWERGVEAETLACGTGACAAVVAAAKHLNLKQIEMEVAVRSGESLQISFDGKNLVMTGPALRC